MSAVVEGVTESGWVQRLGFNAWERPAMPAVLLPIWAPLFGAAGVTGFALLPAYGLYLLAGLDPITGEKVATNGHLSWSPAR